MERKYCDRCGQGIENKPIPSWIKYYDDRDKEDSVYWRHWEHGSFTQTICHACLDELKPVFHSKVATEPAGVQIREKIMPVPVPTTEQGCTGCWWCQLQRRFRRK